MLCPSVSENFMKICSTVCSAMLLRGMDCSEKIGEKILCLRGWMEHLENVHYCYLYWVLPTLKISWKSVHSFFRNVANKQTDRQTNRQATDNDENITFAMAEVINNFKLIWMKYMTCDVPWSMNTPWILESVHVHSPSCWSLYLNMYKLWRAIIYNIYSE